MPNKNANKKAWNIHYWLMLFGCVVLLIASIAIELTPNAVKTAIGIPLVATIGTICIIGSVWGTAWSLFKIFGRHKHE